MSNYIEFGVTLTQGQKNSLRAAINARRGVTLRLPHAQLSGNDKLMLTGTQIKRIQKAKVSRKGVDVNLSKTQLEKTGGFLGTLLAGLAGSMIPALLGIGKGLRLPGTQRGGRVKKTSGRGLRMPGT